jgi:hypothetical protein
MNIDRMLAQLTDREVDRLLDGRYPVHGQDVEALVAAIETLRSSQGGAPPHAGAELAAVFAHGLPADGSAPPEWAIPPDPETPVRSSWRARLRTSTARALTVLSVPLRTLTSKLVVAVVVAVAAIGGFYAAGVDVPGLPDRPLQIDEVRDSDHLDPPQGGTGDVQEEQRDRGVGGDDRSQPATGGEPAASEQPSDGKPVGQSTAGPGNSAHAGANAPGQSSEAEKAERKAERKAEKAERKAERKAEKAERKAERKAEKAERKAERKAEKEKQ